MGDCIVPSPIEMEYPVLLDFEAPKVIAYSKETIIAEKLETIVKRSTANSRLKDFYDIYYLAQTTNFSLDVLSNSIKSTFMNRGTPLPEETFFPEIIKDDAGMEIRWKAFISRHGQLTDISYQELIKKLDSFTRPIIMKNQEESIWDFNTWCWCVWQNKNTASGRRKYSGRKKEKIIASIRKIHYPLIAQQTVKGD